MFVLRCPSSLDAFSVHISNALLPLFQLFLYRSQRDPIVSEKLCLSDSLFYLSQPPFLFEETCCVVSLEFSCDFVLQNFFLLVMFQPVYQMVS